MYDRDGGGGRSATPTGFAFVWITCLCHVWSVTGYWSSGLGGGGRAGPNAAGCGALEVEIIWERMQLWRLGGALRAAALHSVSPEAQGRLIDSEGPNDARPNATAPARYATHRGC